MDCAVILRGSFKTCPYMKELVVRKWKPVTFELLHTLHIARLAIHGACF